MRVFCSDLQKEKSQTSGLFRIISKHHDIKCDEKECEEKIENICEPLYTDIFSIFFQFCAMFFLFFRFNSGLVRKEGKVQM